MIKKILLNPAAQYILSRYGTYFIQFINSLFVAVYLGPYYLGIWGFINLVIGYIGHLNLGIPHSTNVILSINKQKEEYVKKIMGNGLTMILILSGLVFLFLLLGKLEIIQIGDEKYKFSSFFLPVVTIAILTHVNAYFSNIFRVYGKVFAIAINQSLYPIIVLFLIPFFKGEDLLWAMLYANSVAFILSFILYIVQFPVKIKPLINWNVFKQIQIKGWYLFIYTASFYLIILSTNTFISGNYKIEEFGIFTFSYSMANVILLLLKSISFLIFPKVLNRFAHLSNLEISRLLGDVRTAYISLSHLLIHTVIMLFPLFLLFFPSYSASSLVFKTISLTMVLYTNSFGYQGLLMAKSKDKLIAGIALSALAVNIGLVAVFVFVLKVHFSVVILATLTCYLLYVYFLGVYGRKTLDLKTDFLSVIKDVYPWRMMLPFALSIALTLLKLPEYFFVVPFLLYLILNFKDLKRVKDFVLKVIKKPNLINI